MAQVDGNAPSITLYTNHRCPWAHRAHIVLKELGLNYEEVIIDLDTPRKPWYLKINPRGLVPSIDYNGEIITESGIVATFLADACPSHLFPAAGNPKDALTRARINFFVDTYFTKVNSYWFRLLKSEGEEQERLAKEYVEILGKEIEPLLKDAAPFFGGSTKVTLAEALTAPFTLRVYKLVQHGLFPQSVGDDLKALPNFSKWAAEVIKQESVLYIWNEENVMNQARQRIATLRAQAKST